VSALSARVLQHVAYYQHFDAVVDTIPSYRVISRLLVSLTTAEKGLAAMSKFHLTPPLATLLSLPAQDVRIPSWLMLSGLSSNVGSCSALLGSAAFQGLLRVVKRELDTQCCQITVEELEYLACILDRGCCHPSIVKVLQDKLLRLVCLLLSDTSTVSAQLVSLRALCHCAFAQPDRLAALIDDGLVALRCARAATSSLRSDSLGAKSSDGHLGFLKEFAFSDRLTHHPPEAQLALHFSRVLLCEAVSVSQAVCEVCYPDFDAVGLINALSTAFDAACIRFEDSRRRCLDAELLNAVLAMCHLVTCTVLRQDIKTLEFTVAEQKGDKYSAKGQNVVSVLNGVLDVLRSRLWHNDVSNPQEDAAAVVAASLVVDRRVLFFSTALLREICAKPLHSCVLSVVRTTNFQEVLDASVQTAVKVFSATKRKDKQKEDKLSGAPEGGVSPLAKHLDGCDLAMVFEHLFICMRHLITQAMYVASDAVDVGASDGASDSAVREGAMPWLWNAQELLQMHRMAPGWMLEVAKAYISVPAFVLEMTRYVCALATFHVAPMAAPKDPKTAAWSRGLPVADPRLLDVLTIVLGFSTDASTHAVACIAVANIVEYQRQQHTLEDEPDLQRGPDLERLIAPLLLTLQLLPGFPREMAGPCLKHVLRIVVDLLAFDVTFLTCRLFASGLLDVLQKTFAEFYHDAHRIQAENDYASTLQIFALILRNWITAGCSAEADIRRQNFQGRSLSKMRKGSKERKDSSASILSVLDNMAPEEPDHVIVERNLHTGTLLNFLTTVILKLTATRKIPDQNAFIEGMLDDVLICLRTVLYRQDVRSPMNWEHLKQEPFEAALEDVHAHRQKFLQPTDDHELMHVLYLLTKQGFQYKGKHFPSFLQSTAYATDTEHTPMKDVAAVCCAILSTTKKANSMTSSVGSEHVTDAAEFINSMAFISDARLKLWHYRVVTQWSLRAQVLDEVARNAAAFKCVVDKLLDWDLGRYSVVFLQNLSVYQWQAIFQARGALKTVCQAYMFLAGNTEGELRNADECRLLRHLSMATVRNCLVTHRI